MESCQEVVTICKGQNDKHGQCILVRCVLKKEHEGEHEIHVWLGAYNRATKRNGIIKVIRFI